MSEGYLRKTTPPFIRAQWSPVVVLLSEDEHVEEDRKLREDKA